MTLMNLTVGLEEEFFLVDKITGDICQQWPDELWKICHQKFPGQIIREFISGQVELVSSPAHSIQELHTESFLLRSFLVEQSAKFNLAPMACASHPKAKWHQQKPTVSKRYQRLADELKISAERLLVCGTHVHVGIKDLGLRLRVMNELSYYLPIFLALSSSSPFWASQDTGLVSYRAAVLSSLPRSGLPPIFTSVEDYQSYLKLMIDSSAITSAKELWWDLRLSANFPTVEIRIADTCTSHLDVMAIVALIKSLVAYIIDKPKLDLNTLNKQLLCARENRWRAQRYSFHDGKFLDAQYGKLHSSPQVIDEIVERIAPYARLLDCFYYLSHCKNICRIGTSSDLQRKVYNDSLAKGHSKNQAIDLVSQFLIARTANIFNPTELTKHKLRENELVSN